MAQNKVVSTTLIELTAEDGMWLYNESELGRNFVRAVTIGKDEARSHWVECTDAEKRAYEEEQERLLGKDTDTADLLSCVATEGTVECPAESTIPSDNVSGIPTGCSHVDITE